MQYEIIEIKGCDRFNVSGITGLKMTLTSTIQMILGKNGAGKSSLMEIGFTPFAPEERFFPKGGSWEVVAYHRGSRYRIKATYGDKTRYSFKCDDGEELNKSHNVTMQNDLIYQYLGITKDIQQLLQGHIQLTKLTPQARRDWMAKLSQSDMSFAFKALKFYKQKLSYHQSICTFLKKRINEEQEKLIAEDDLKAMMESSKALHEQYDELQSLPHYDIKEPVTLEAIIEASNEVMDLTGTFLLKNPVSLSYASVEALYNEMIEKDRDSRFLMGQAGQIIDDLANLQQEVGRIEALLGEDSVKLTEWQGALNKELADIPSELGVPTHYLQSAGNAISALRFVLGKVPGEVLSDDQAREIIAIADRENAKLEKAKLALEQITSNLEVLTKVSTVACPSCNHSFKPGVDPELYEKLEQRRLSGVDFIDHQTKVVESAISDLERVKELEICKQELHLVRHKYLKDSPGLFGYLDSIEKWGIGFNMDLALRQYESAAVLHHKRQALLESLESVNKALENQVTYSTEFPSLIKRMEERLELQKEIRGQMEIVNQSFDQLSSEYQQQLEIEKDYAIICDKEDRMFDLIDGYLEHRHNQLRAIDLKAVTTNIAILENAINDNDVIKTNIKDFTRSLEDAMRMEKGAKAIVDELNPKTGLIAIQIREQIGMVLDAMNGVIRKIWGYDIRIGVGDVDEGGLDYKLPLYVNGVPRKDIDEGSSSMKEIINRAFVLTAIICLGLEDYPLFQDEPAITFDTEHGLKFIPMIKGLIETDKFTQLVLISHDRDTQTAFPSADICLLGDLKLEHIRNYNNHVEFYYDAA